MTPLCELAKKYGTDKCVPHNYTPVYWRLLGERTQAVKKVLEVGIAEGAKSLQMWEEFFPHAIIIGIDLDRRMQLNKGRIRSHVADQASPSVGYIAEREGGNFDLIVEDGSHKPAHQIAAMRTLLPYLAKDGLYFIEDIWCDVGAIAQMIPPRYVYEVYESSKPLPVTNHMMVIRRA